MEALRVTCLTFFHALIALFDNKVEFLWHPTFISLHKNGQIFDLLTLNRVDLNQKVHFLLHSPKLLQMILKFEASPCITEPFDQILQTIWQIVIYEQRNERMLQIESSVTQIVAQDDN